MAQSIVSFKVFVLVSIITINLNARANQLVDAETKSVLPLASITDRQGNMVGMTDREGSIPQISADCYPITFNYMGYEPLEIQALGGGNVEMYRHLYELPEIEFSPMSRPLLHLTGYMREVASVLGSSDSVTMFRESIVDFLVPVEKSKVKGWAKARELASKTYVRMTDSSGIDSVSSEHELEYMLWGKIHKLIPDPIKIPESIKNGHGVVSDTVMGKYSPKIIWHRSGNVMRWYRDALANKKGHVSTPWALKLLGLTTDITDMSLNYVFASEDANQVTPADISQMSMSINMSVKGKLFKTAFKSSTPVNVRTYVEVYLTGREFLSDEEGKVLKSNPLSVGTSEIVAPPNVPALHVGIKEIVERVEALR